ncbi:MAG: ATP-binding protein [Planctomycetaceae bacterium]|nr:ATP-binding protein [Planctomycetaceae bacterium]
MLIEFNIGNFRSFGETQKFSFVAGNYEKNLPENKIVRPLPGMKGLDYLSATAIYGANASGKSNLLTAFNALCNFVGQSFRSDPNWPTCAVPFKLNESFHKLPTTFDIHFVIGDVRYQYTLSLTAEKVTVESLIAYPKGRKQEWYRRQWNEATEQYDWDFANNLVKKGLPQIAKITRPNVAFLSAAAHLNHTQLTEGYNWFTKSVKRLNFAEGILVPIHTIESMEKSEKQYAQILSFLQNADFDITKGLISEKELPDNEISKMIPPPVWQKIIQKQKEQNLQSTFRSVSVSFFHKGKKEDIEIDFENEESAGTKRYFSLLGPWLDVLENGYVLMIDELETCLHPLLVVELIKLFRSQYNKNGAQLIFTTHNPLLLDETLLRRDQIWFTEKKPTGETNLYPLSDFSPRKGEALMKGYLTGRYGSIPFIPNGLGLKDSE